MVWWCKGNQKRCRAVVFDHGEFLGKHQWHWTQSWAGAIILVWGDPSPWTGTFFVRFGFGALQWNWLWLQKAGGGSDCWWRLMTRLGWPSSLQLCLRGSCYKISPWACYQIPFPCEWPFVLELDRDVLCWEDHSPDLSSSRGSTSSQTAVDWEGPFATWPNIPMMQSRPQHQQG